MPKKRDVIVDADNALKPSNAATLHVTQGSTSVTQQLVKPLSPA